MKLSLVPTPTLVSYIQILEKFSSSYTEMFNYFDVAIKQRVAPKSRFEEFAKEIEITGKKTDDILLKLQQELDSRMKKDIGMQRGMVFHIQLLTSFNELMEEVHKEHSVRMKSSGMQLVGEKGDA